MNTPESLAEFHRRCHESFSKLIAHCGNLTAAELYRELEGFGYGTVQLQIHHVIAAERYWIGVLEGRIDVDDDETEHPGVRELEAFRKQVFDLCQRYLSRTSADELARPREMVTWGGKKRLLVPEQVIIRTQVHIYHHQGQILAMCRLLGKPQTNFDYPIGV